MTTLDMMTMLVQPGQNNKHYQRYLVDFMEFCNGGSHDKDVTFTDDELNGITPGDVKGWMFQKVFGQREDEGAVQEGTDFLIRSSTLEVMKKALSWYLPDRLQVWSQRSLTGNATRSKEVNDFIKFIKKMEVRRVGKESNAKNAMTMAQFRAALKILEDKKDFENTYRYTTMIKYQYHLITRCDDMANFLINDVRGHSDPRFSSFALQTRVFWSKNVQEERDCPNQIFLGADDPDFCLLLALGFYLELWLIDGVGSRAQLLFSDEVVEAGNRSNVGRLKERYKHRLTSSVFSHPDFISISRGRSKLGSHSIRKYPATYARSNGCSIDEIDIRGRWKRNTKRTVDRYVDCEQQWIDGKVAGALCVGGAVKYDLVVDCGVSLPWLLENVVPGIAGFYNDDNNSIAEVLALPVLWGCLDAEYSLRVDENLVEKVRRAYEIIRILPEVKNPVVKRLLVVFPSSGQLCIEEMHGAGNIRNRGQQQQQNQQQE